MTAPSDMGGRTEFFGPVIRESDEPVFHERWEGRVFGISNFLLPLLGRNIDILRFSMEQTAARGLSVELLPTLARRLRDAA